MTRSRVAFALSVAVAFPALVAAQPSRPDNAALPAMFAGVGIGPATRDAGARMRLFEKGRTTLRTAEIGVAVSRRVGVGLDYSQPSAATAFTTAGAGRAQVAGRQEERVLLGVLRARVAAGNRWAADATGGFGVLFQHHQTGGCMPAQPRCDNTDGSSLTDRSAAWALGLDIPVRLARRFAIAPAARVQFLRRGEHTSETDLNLPWQYERTSSTRVAFVVSGRVGW